MSSTSRSGPSRSRPGFRCRPSPMSSADGTSRWPSRDARARAGGDRVAELPAESRRPQPGHEADGHHRPHHERGHQLALSARHRRRRGGLPPGRVRPAAGQRRGRRERAARRRSHARQTGRRAGRLLHLAARCRQPSTSTRHAGRRHAGGGDQPRVCRRMRPSPRSGSITAAARHGDPAPGRAGAPPHRPHRRTGEPARPASIAGKATRRRSTAAGIPVQPAPDRRRGLLVRQRRSA